MNYKDYRCMKIGDWCSVGMFGNDIYAFEHIGGIGCHSTYYQITKEEFNDFPQNQSEILQDAHRVICTDYFE